MKDVSQIDRYESVYNTLVYFRDDILVTISDNIPSDHYTEANSFDVAHEYINRATAYVAAAMDNHSEDYKEKVKSILYKLDDAHHLDLEEIELLKRAVLTSL